MSRYLGYHPSYFSHHFKKLTGQSFSLYLTDMRIKKAKDFLANTAMSIDEISEKVGFQNRNYFSAVFKRTTGISPAKYRNNIILNYYAVP